MSEKNHYIIDLKRLPVGTHSFDITLDDAFFKSLEKTEILSGNVECQATLNLREEDYQLNIAVRGTVFVVCDRCLDPMPLEINDEQEIFSEDEVVPDETGKTLDGKGKEEKQMSFAEAFKHRQTWSFAFGKFMTDGVWWFFLFWAPAYFQDQFGIKASDPQGIALIFTLYAIVTVVSLFGGYLPKIFVEKKGMEPYAGRMRAMLIFAFFPIFALFAQPLGGIYGPWAVAIIIGIVGAAHQSWSANIFSTTGDMFPKSAVATITGIGAMAGGVGSFLINKGSGMLFDHAAGLGEAFQFMGFSGKPAGYMIIFCICAVAYLIGWSVMKILVPKHQPVVLK